MIYVASDIHGCYDKYKALLERLNLKEDDTLYILGDLVDRGEGGIKVILDLISRNNVFCLRGNHDHEAYILLKNFAIPNDGYASEALMETFQLWLEDGGSVTYKAFLEISDEQKRNVLTFLNSLPLYEEVEVQGQKYHLSHTVPEKEKMLQIDKCKLSDFIIGEPDYEFQYFKDVVLVTGHTPTGFIDTNYKGRIWKGNNHIAVDCGAVFGNPLGCICLDTMEEIYVNTIKLWLDDIREAPGGYYHCKSVNEAKKKIAECEQVGTVIDVIDCDHDLGDYAEDGGDGIKLLDWLVERKTFYPINLHTMNPVGRENMLREIERYWNAK